MSIRLMIKSDNIFTLGKELAALAKQFETTVSVKNPQPELPVPEPKVMSEPETVVEAPKKKAGRPKKMKAVEPVDFEEVESSEEETSTIDVGAMKIEADDDSVREALKNLISSDPAVGPKKAKEVLGAFGATKFSELDPKKYGAVLASINAAL
jgi:hypothetical protein